MGGMMEIGRVRMESIAGAASSLRRVRMVFPVLRKSAADAASTIHPAIRSSNARRATGE